MVCVLWFASFGLVFVVEIDDPVGGGCVALAGLLWFQNNKDDRLF